MGITIENITVATTNTEKMVEFYNAVLDANLKGFEPFPNATFYSGNLAGIALTICPNTIAQVEAKQNRQQFRFKVDNIHDTFVTALSNGATELSAIEEQGDLLICAVYDPDGNSIVFSQEKSS
jgi:catechol 2,3-dioxygenase-like lactoylglutathione lyase family enzyme